VNGAILWVVLVLVVLEGALLLVLLARSGRGARGESAVLREELRLAREEAGRAAAAQRDELGRGLTASNEMLRASLAGMAEMQRVQLDGLSRNVTALSESNQASLTTIRTTVDARVRELQDGNEKKLDEMRRTVDEKLQTTLEKRLGESFKLVQGQLEAVQRGLGEMQALATGVGDLKKVLSNVKVRGTWGEVQLGALLAQVLSPEQYAVNVATRPGSAERVEFCVRLPGRDEGGAEVLLPIDAKFPLEDWQRLVEASERADAPGVEAAGKALEQRLLGCARDVHDKYVCPPHTTDFGLLYLPTEGLYAEVVRRAGLLEALQRDWKVSVAGPTTLLALLTSLQMGFRTLAIQRRSAEVWQVLGAVKGEFATFGAVLERVEKKLQEAQNQIHQVGVRRRAIERTLREVEGAPGAAAPGGALPAVADEPDRLGLRPAEPPPGD
jgi:DNA recombination protein RmuC